MLVALGAQGTLYLALRHMATATMPAWAHHHHARPGPLPWQPLVPVELVRGPGGTPAGPDVGLAPMSVPAFSAAPEVVLAPPSLGPDRPNSTTQQRSP